MIQKKIEWLSNEEAIITFNERNIELTVFAHPYKDNNKKVSKVYLDCFDTYNIEKQLKNSLFALPQANSFEYLLGARILDVNKSIVTINNFIISLDYIPEYFNDGDYIEFVTKRLDLDYVI